MSGELDSIEVVTFDCYGTLIHASAGLGGFLYCLARACGEDRPRPGVELAERFAQLQFELVQGPFRPYQEIIGLALQTLASEHRWRLDPTDIESLMQSIGSWQPYPDARPALRAIAGRQIRIGLVSNGCERVMRHSLRQLDTSFEAIVLAEQCGAYKPSSVPLEELLRRLRVHPSRALHVAGGFAYDIPAAQELGCLTAWVNRSHERRPVPPDPYYEWRSLLELADLTSLTPGYA
jgi:2-haloalkanoic acid dehalogenase type II